MTKKRVILYPKICAHAKALGVTREHLYRVLTGQRASDDLVIRYRRLADGLDPQPSRYKGGNRLKIAMAALNYIAYSNLTKVGMVELAVEALNDMERKD